MKLPLICLLVLSTVTIIYCQETTTVSSPPADEPKLTTTDSPPTTSAAPEGSSPKPEEGEKKEEKPQEEKKEEQSPEEKKDGEKKEDEQEKPRESDEQPKILFVQQHVRDPVTGMIYTRQVPVIPNNYLRPMQPYQPQGQPQQGQPDQGEREQGPAPYDPLGQYSSGEKKRQYFQDMLQTQLLKFEGEIEPMIERESNQTIKNDIEEVLIAVSELRKVLDAHQIFNISQVMNNWKQGRLGQEQQQGGPQGPQDGQPQPPPYRVRQPTPVQTVRTLILVPTTTNQNRQPQQQYIPQYPQMPPRQTIPVFHFHQRRSSAYQPEAGQPQAQQENHQIEPEAQPSEEYVNGNDLYGY